MISKTEFVNFMEIIKDADNFMADNATVCNKYGLEYEGGAADMCCKLHSAIVDFLSREFNDTDQWISWWVYDCQYGNVGATIKIQNENDNWIPYTLDTPESLYDFLIKRY